MFWFFLVVTFLVVGFFGVFGGLFFVGFFVVVWDFGGFLFGFCCCLGFLGVFLFLWGFFVVVDVVVWFWLFGVFFPFFLTDSFTLLDLQNSPPVEAQLVGGRKFSFQWIRMDQWFGFQLPKAGNKWDKLQRSHG